MSSASSPYVLVFISQSDILLILSRTLNINYLPWTPGLTDHDPLRSKVTRVSPAISSQLTPPPPTLPKPDPDSTPFFGVVLTRDARADAALEREPPKEQDLSIYSIFFFNKPGLLPSPVLLYFNSTKFPNPAASHFNYISVYIHVCIFFWTAPGICM